MSDASLRGMLLHQQGRYKEALRELFAAIAEQPSDIDSLHIIVDCFLELNQFDDAEKNARNLVAADPDASASHYCLSRVLIKRNRIKVAREAIEQAIELDPEDPDNFGLKGIIELNESRWKEAIAQADTGLMLDPENALCLNVRTQALVQSNDTESAEACIQDALSQRPDNAFLHANQGWVLLRQGRPGEAREYFREALRLDPELDFARSGLLESIKAQNFIYRWMLRYVFFVGSLTRQQQWLLILSLYFAARVVKLMEKSFPPLQPYTTTIIIAYNVFVAMTWIAPALFNLLLFLHPTGKLCLSRDDRRGALLLGTIISLAIFAGLLGWTLGSLQLTLLGPITLGLVCLPAAVVYKMEKGWPRNSLFAVVCAMVATGVFISLPMDLLNGRADQFPANLQLHLLKFYPILVPVIALGANALAGARVTR